MPISPNKVKPLARPRLCDIDLQQFVDELADYVDARAQELIAARQETITR